MSVGTLLACQGTEQEDSLVSLASPLSPWYLCCPHHLPQLSTRHSSAAFFYEVGEKSCIRPPVTS